MSAYRDSPALRLLLALIAAAPAAAEAPPHSTIMEGTVYQTDQWVKTGADPDPVVMVIGGVHGNEIAGYKAANVLLDWEVTKGTLVVIPEAHKEAIRRNVRGYPGNMNAMFPGDPEGTDMERLAHAIWTKIKEAQPGLLITLHESVGFYSEASWSYGYTLCHDFDVLNPFFQRCINRVNPDIDSRRCRFQIKVEPHETCPTYTAWKWLRLPATSIETCMEIDLGTRIDHQLMMLMGCFDEVGLEYAPTRVPRLSTSDRPAGTDLDTYVYELTGEYPLLRHDRQQPQPEDGTAAAPTADEPEASPEDKGPPLPGNALSDPTAASGKLGHVDPHSSPPPEEPGAGTSGRRTYVRIAGVVVAVLIAGVGALLVILGRRRTGSEATRTP